MPICFRSNQVLPAFAAISLALAAPLPCFAADASPWDSDIRSAARLIAASASGVAGAALRAGVEIKLLPGWKTYWRYPGDSGVPPILDFSASDNIKTVTVLFPAPARFPDGAGGHSIGYKGNVIWPLHVVAKDASKPVTLRLKMDYAACEKLCVPAQASTELVLAAIAGSEDAPLAAAETMVPKPGAVGDGGALAIRSVRRDNSGSKPTVVVDVAAPAGVAVDLFAEGPTADWALPLPERVAGASAGLTRFSFALDGLPPGGKAAGATLRLTAVSAAGAVEAAFHLD